MRTNPKEPDNRAAAIVRLKKAIAELRNTHVYLVRDSRGAETHTVRECDTAISHAEALLLELEVR